MGNRSAIAEWDAVVTERGWMGAEGQKKNETKIYGERNLLKRQWTRR
jgi:hypothetical protein